MRENVIFDRITERADSKSSWTLSLIMDLKPYRNLIKSSLEQVAKVSKANMDVIKEKLVVDLEANTSYTGHFTALNVELAHLNDTMNEKLEIFRDYNRIHRHKRSLLPFAGDILNFMFGTVTEDNLDSVNEAVNQLNLNQEKIQHVLSESLSMINVSHNNIVENRNRINTLNEGMKALYDHMAKTSSRSERNMNQLRTFLTYYMQLQRMVSDARELVYETIMYFESFQGQIDVLASGRLTPHILKPSRLLSILNEIREKLPSEVKLPFNPTKKLWDYYKILSCSTYFKDDRVLVIIKIPLISVGEGMIIYKVHNLPVTNIKLFNSNWVVDLDKHLVAKYNLEASAIAVNKRRTKYMLLSEEEANICTQKMHGLCEFKSFLSN